jgi:hypothetical protein
MVNTESEVKNLQESLQDHLDSACLALGLTVGRRLFESGHFSFAALSAARALSLAEAKEIVSATEARSHLPGRLVREAETLASLRYLASATGILGETIEAFLAFLAHTELNHVDSLPVPTARLAADALAYLAIASGGRARLSATLAAFERTAATWEERLARALGNSHPTPLSFDGLLGPAEERLLLDALVVLAERTEALHRALCRLARTRLLAPGNLPWASDRARARDTLFALVVDKPSQDAETALSHLVEGRAREAALSLQESIARTAALEAALRSEHMTGRDAAPGSARRDLTLENAAYVESLGRQLRLQGVDAAEADDLSRATLDYASHHGSPCAEILDDELARLGPRIPREALVRARLRVRHEDRDYPLSVAARSAILQVTGHS